MTKDLERKSHLMRRGEFLRLMAMLPLAFRLDQTSHRQTLDDAAVLREQTIREHDVSILTLHQLAEQERRRLFIRASELQELPRFWDSNRLALLDYFLTEIIPDHFFGFDPLRGRMHLILSTKFRSDSFDDHPKRYIQLDYQQFHPAYAQEALEGLVHELTHDITPIRIVVIPNPQVPLFTSRRIESPWFERIEDALGGRYQAVRQQVYYHILEERRKFPLGTENHRFYTQLAAALSYENDPAEVIGYLSGHYLHGWNYFSQMYEEIFPQEAVNKLYQFGKDIFRGREYQQFPV